MPGRGEMPFSCVHVTVNYFQLRELILEEIFINFNICDTMHFPYFIGTYRHARYPWVPRPTRPEGEYSQAAYVFIGLVHKNKETLQIYEEGICVPLLGHLLQGQGRL